MEWKNRATTVIPKNFVIDEYFNQKFNATDIIKKGQYEHNTFSAGKNITFNEYVELAKEHERDLEKYDCSTDEGIKRAIDAYWVEIVERSIKRNKTPLKKFESREILYGTDVAGTMFRDNLVGWNLNKLGED